MDTDAINPTEDMYARFNVRGFHFEIDLVLLESRPGSRLLDIWRRKLQGTNAVYVNKDPFVFSTIIDFYITGSLHVPDGCFLKMTEEMQFWGVPQEALCTCCVTKLAETQRDAKDSKTLMRTWRQYTDVTNDVTSGQLGRTNKIHQAFIFLEGNKPTAAAKVYAFFILILGIVSALLAVAKTLPTFKHYVVISSTPGATTLKEAGVSLHLIVPEYVVLAILCADLILRFVVYPSKIAFMRSPLNIIAFLSTVPVFIMATAAIVITFSPSLSAIVIGRWWTALVWMTRMMGLLQTGRVFYVFSLARFYEPLRIVLCAVRASGVLLLLVSCLMPLTAIVFGFAVFLAEFNTEYTNLSSAADGLWFAMVTMATVGYGDIIPVTIAGKMIAVVCAMTGIFFLILPIPTIANNFIRFRAISKLAKSSMMTERAVECNTFVMTQMDQSGETSLLRGETRCQ